MKRASPLTNRNQSLSASYLASMLAFLEEKGKQQDMTSQLSVKALCPLMGLRVYLWDSLWKYLRAIMADSHPAPD